MMAVNNYYFRTPYKAYNEPSDDSEKGAEPTDLLIKHPLQNEWTLYYYTGEKKNWGDNMKEVVSFHTVEDFWSVFNHIKSPSEIKSGCDYYLFKKNILPMWEDEANKAGGRWVFSIEKKQRELDLDNYWLDTILCLIGEAFHENSDDVNGATVNVRPKGDRICFWTAGSDKSTLEAIGYKIKEMLKIPPSIKITFQLHADSSVRSGSMTKSSMSL
jgi:translation initiation factor 4E